VAASYNAVRIVHKKLDAKVTCVNKPVVRRASGKNSCVRKSEVSHSLNINKELANVNSDDTCIVSKSLIDEVNSEVRVMQKKQCKSQSYFNRIAEYGPCHLSS
jgi:hypothetical protein